MSNYISLFKNLKAFLGLILYFGLSTPVNSKLIFENSKFQAGLENRVEAIDKQDISSDISENQLQVNGSESINLPVSTRTLGSFRLFLKQFKINNQIPVADTNSKEYFISLLNDSSSSLQIEYLPFEQEVELYVNSSLVKSGITINVPELSPDLPFTLELRKNGEVLGDALLNFTFLPLVQVYTDVTPNLEYNLARIAVTEAVKDSAELLLTNIKIRGGISISYEKKSFAINLRDSLGVDSEDRSFFGFRNDNDWILDAMYIDPARMRNRVSTDLWNDFATKPYWFAQEPNMLNGTRGQFVELFINDVYHGLYCMTEEIDRKQLDLKKLVKDSVADELNYVQRGALYKAVSWTTAVFMGYPYRGDSIYPDFSNFSGSWSGYECKYPELDEGEPIRWNPLYEAVKVPSTYYTMDAQFEQTVAERFDLPVYLDYYLFIELMLATDNHGKNTYSGIYDQSQNTMISVTPWDLDATWGLRWDGTKTITYPQQNFDQFLIQNDGQMNLFLRLKSLDFDDWSSTKLKNRYLELRAGAFGKDSLINRFKTYASLFINSKADQREINKWGSYGLVQNISSEMDYVSEWISSRLQYLDIQYLGEPYAATNEFKYVVDFVYSSQNQTIHIKGLNVGDYIALYSSDGKLVYMHQTTTEMEINSTFLPQGIYLVKSGGFVRKFVKN